MMITQLFAALTDLEMDDNREDILMQRTVRPPVKILHIGQSIIVKSYLENLCTFNKIQYHAHCTL